MLQIGDICVLPLTLALAVNHPGCVGFNLPESKGAQSSPTFTALQENDAGRAAFTRFVMTAFGSLQRNSQSHQSAQ